jgi:hypothetical protein
MKHLEQKDESADLFVSYSEGINSAKNEILEDLDGSDYWDIRK